MAGVPHNLENISLRLSQVLGEIGVNDEIVMKRRLGSLIKESAKAHILCLQRDNDNTQVYYFGSQSEGSTTIGINSDTDQLLCEDLYHVIPDWAEWKDGVTNILMVQDECTAPGYCLLQQLRDDEPLPINYVPDEQNHMDAKGRVLVKNTLFDIIFRCFGVERHGPAGNRPEGNNTGEIDFVIALCCAQWPTEGGRWLNRRSRSGWPSAQLKSECEISGCFLVPVGSKISGLDELEWRISTSIAERYLMFSLNRTQLRCYILMKMLLKSYPVFQNVISSYMCKTVLFHCIENADPAFWQECNLLLCLNETLQVLYNCIYCMNCPHFIIPENNLMAGRISAEQQHSLLVVIHDIINSEGRMLLQIEIDDLGARLQVKLNRILVQPCHIHYDSAVEIHKHISADICLRLASGFLCVYTVLAKSYNNNGLQDAIKYFLRLYVKLSQQNPDISCLERHALDPIVPLLCSHIGSLLATYYKTINQPMSDDVVMWLKRGLNSDVSSGWLKLATVCYSFGYTDMTEKILRRVDQFYDRDVVMPVCSCHADVRDTLKPGFDSVAGQIQITEFRHIVSYCVKFMRCETNIVPEEMRQEYNRSSPEDVQSRGIYDGWMDLAVIDSLPYLYFLQYKTYRRLRNRGEQLTALHKLQQVIGDEINLTHKETALNLLGQCMEQENLPIDAFLCYERSLQVRPRNNAANFHMYRLLHR